MNPFPLNRLARVHRVHVRDCSTPKNGPMVRLPHLFACVANPRRSPMAKPSHRGVQSRKGFLDPPPSWVVGGCRVA